MQDELLATTKDIFRSESTPVLLQKMLLFEAVSVKPLVDVCVNLLSAELQPVNSNASVVVSKILAAPLRWGIRRFCFRVFTGGETLEEATTAIRQAQSKAHVGAIIDHSTEEFEDAAYWDINLGHKIKLVRQQ